VDSSGSGHGPAAGCCEYGDESSEGGEFLDHLSDHQLLSDSALRK